MRCVLLGLALLLSACEAEPSVTDYAPEPRLELEITTWRLVIDDSVRDDALETVLDAAHAWERALSASCPIAFVVSYASVSGDLPVDEHTIAVKIDDGIAPRSAGEAVWGIEGSGLGAIAFLRTRRADTPLERYHQALVARHELGHGAKLDHRSEGVMQEKLSRIDGITAGDAAAFAAMHCALIHT